MSFEAMRRGVAVKGLSKADKVLLWVLADHANQQDSCWQSVKTLAEEAEMSERQVQRSIISLENKGLVQVQRGSGRHRTSLYRLTLPSRDERVTFETERVTFETERVTSETERVTPTSPESVYESVKESVKESSSLQVEPAKSEAPSSQAALLEDAPPELPTHRKPSKRKATDDAAPKDDMHRRMFEELCFITQGHRTYKALGKMGGALGKEAKTLRELGYTVEDLQAWHAQIWPHHWKVKKGSKPSFTDISNGLAEYVEKGRNASLCINGAPSTVNGNGSGHAAGSKVTEVFGGKMTTVNGRTVRQVSYTLD